MLNNARDDLDQLFMLFTDLFKEFLLVLGIGLAPLPSDSGTVFIERVVNVVVAAAYTIGLASVTHWLFSTMNKDIKL